MVEATSESAWAQPFRRRQMMSAGAAVILSLAFHAFLVASSPQIRFPGVEPPRGKRPRPFVVQSVTPDVLPPPAPAADAAFPADLPGTAAFLAEEAAAELARVMREEDLLPPPPVVAELAGMGEPTALPNIDMDPGESLPRPEILEIPEPELPELEPDLPRSIIPEAPRSAALADIIGPSAVGDTIGSGGPGGVRPFIPVPALPELPATPEIVRLTMRASLGNALENLALPLPEPLVTEPAEPPPPPPMTLQGEATEPLDPFLKVDLFTYVDPGEPDLGYFMVQIGPRPDLPLKVLPKDIFFVIDSSNSMTERKLEVCKEGLKRAIRQLAPHDRFNVATFKAEPMFFRSQWTRASPSEIADAAEFIDKLRAGGQTDIYGSLDRILGLRRNEQRPILVLLVSDGNPTTGLVDSGQIINRLTEKNRRNIAVYCFSGGTNVNLYLLDLLAYRNQGESRYVRDHRNIPQAVVDFCNEIADPTVIDLDFRFSGVDGGEIVPTVLPHLYAGRRLTMYGRYPVGSEALGARIVGTNGDRRHELVFSKRFSGAQPAPPDLPRLWAAQRIYGLIGQLTEGENPDLRQEIARLSKRYGIRTPYEERRR